MNAKTILTWIVGLWLCALFIIWLLPVEGSSGHWQTLPLNFTTVSILSAGCCIILRFTYFFYKLFRGK